MARGTFPQPTYETISDDRLDEFEGRMQGFDITGVFIPIELLIHPCISKTEAILFGFVSNMSKTKHGCYARNRHLANLIGSTPQTITNSLGNLEKWGFVRIVYDDDSSNMGRRIYVEIAYPHTYRRLTSKWHDFILKGIKESYVEYINKLCLVPKKVYRLINILSNSTYKGEHTTPKKPSKTFNPPTLNETIEYAQETNLTSIDPEAFFDHFTSNGWKVSGKAPMKDWKAAVRNWNRNDKKWNKKGDAPEVDSNDDKPRAVTRGSDPELFPILCEMNRLNTTVQDDPVLHWQPFIPIAEALLEGGIDPKELIEWREGRWTAEGHMARMVPGGDLWDEFMEWRGGG